MTREELLPVIIAAFEGRPVRWAEAHALGDYDGRERTLEVFNADARDQLELLTRFRSLRPAVESVAGGPVIVIFHTTRETTRLYADVIAQYVEEQLKMLARRASELLPEAHVEFQAAGTSRAPGLVVRVDGRCVLIEYAGTGFDIRLARQSFEDSDPDFRIVDLNRASRSIELLLSEEEEEARFAADLELVPDRDVVNTNSSIDDPPDLKVEDQRVETGMAQPPRKVA